MQLEITKTHDTSQYGTRDGPGSGWHAATSRKQPRLHEVASALVLSGEAPREWRHGIAKRHLPRTIPASFGRLRVLSLSCNAGRERYLSPLAAGTWLELPSPGCRQAASVGVVAGERAT